MAWREKDCVIQTNHDMEKTFKRTPFCDDCDKAEYMRLRSQWEQQLYFYLTDKLDTRENVAASIINSDDYSRVLDSRQYTEQEKEHLQWKLDRMWQELGEVKTVQRYRRAEGKHSMPYCGSELVIL